MVRGAVWVEMFLLLFGDVAFLGFGWLLLILGSCARTSHTSSPSLGRGGSGAVFLLVMSGLSGDVSPLERGSRGVLR